MRNANTEGPISPADRRIADDAGVREYAGQISRLTPRTDSRHVPSGPRDLKDYDQPAYLRRGITLPPIDEGEGEPQLVGAGVASDRNASSPKDRDDRPAFLKRIMD